MTTVINDNVTLDGKGEATVTLSAWFEAGNRDFRYILTAVGAPRPKLYVSQELSNNQFQIAGGVSSGKVSWQVTGIRQDMYANAHPIQVEQAKTGIEQGKYLSPELYGQPGSKGCHPTSNSLNAKDKEGNLKVAFFVAAILSRNRPLFEVLFSNVHG